VLCLWTSASRAAPAPETDTNLLISGNQSLWTESMLWDEQVTLSAGLGYKDNVLLSPFNPRPSPFFLSGLDLAVLRLPLDGWQIEGSIVGDDIRYWHTVNTNSEDLFIGNLRVRRELPGGWLAGLEFRGIFEKQVLDVSTLVGSPTTALVEGDGLSLRPSLRKNLPLGLWVQVEMAATHWYLQAPLDAYWEYGPVETLGCDFGKSADVTLSYAATHQSHSEWVALDAYGRPLPQHLEITQQRVELAWRQTWDASGRLHSSTRLVFAYDEDNGGGYFDDYQYQAIEDIRWLTDNWQIKGSAQLVDEIYPIQGVGVLNGENLTRCLADLSLEVERRIYKSFKGYGKMEYQQAQSNYTGNAGDYIARTVTFGLRWEF
jgi:hypothetical protein